MYEFCSVDMYLLIGVEIANEHKAGHQCSDVEDRLNGYRAVWTIP